ncbi:MAG: thermonuclease family protein [Candidatus Poribacteria bacterium]|nr:thermonuclease family protein [Candidatus Poribacteria bacterium]
MTSHDRVVRAVEEYFSNLPLQGKNIDIEEPIQFGANVGGFADVVLKANDRFVAIAECKNPWNFRESARAQLKSYLCATATLLGVLAIGKNPKDWVFCKNQGNYYFKEISKDDFETRVSTWVPRNSVQYQVDAARQWENTARQIQKSIQKWQITSVVFAILFVIFSASFLVKVLEPRVSSANRFADKGNLYQVLRIIDGDTVEIEYEGDRTSVHLIGVNAPETVHPSKPPERFGTEATTFIQSLLLHKFVYLDFDREKKNKYDRLLAYVYRDSDDLFVNLEIIRQGYGRTDDRFPFKYMNLFKYHESQARSEKKMIWSW